MQRVIKYEDANKITDLCPLNYCPLEVSVDELNSEFRQDELLGIGDYAEVYRGTIHHTPCAIKVLKKKHLRPRALSALSPILQKEVGIMQRNHHPNVMNLLCVSKRDTGDLVITMPLMKGGNLRSLITHRRFQSTSLFERIDICHQALLGLNWLHSQSPSILHLDLKLENILCDGRGNYLLTDFGLSAFLESEVFLERRLAGIGNVAHMAPEVIQRRKFNEKADVYSAAILMWEILTGKEWEEREVRSQLRKSGIYIMNDIATTLKRSVCSKGFRPPLIDVDWPESLKDLLDEMWHIFSDKRPPISSVIDRLENLKKMLVEEKISKMLKDEIAQDFWVNDCSFPGRLDVCSPIPWGIFESSLRQLWKLPQEENNSGDNDFLILKISLNAFQSEIVTLQKFSSLVDALGPLSPRYLVALHTLSGFKWFRPDLSCRNSKLLLAGQKDGAFLVRFSNQLGIPFVIDHVRLGKIIHTNIHQAEDGLRVSADAILGNSKVYQTIDSIIESPVIADGLPLLNYESFCSIGLLDQALFCQGEETENEL